MGRRSIEWNVLKLLVQLMYKVHKGCTMIKFLLSTLFSPQQRKGFTMIELLVVIAVIGVLAVAVLSTINPIEQINKGRDTRHRSDAAQLMNAIDRYYAIQEEFPWNTTNAGVYTPVPASDTPAEAFTYTPGDDSGWLDILVTTDEVKQSFITRLQSTDGDRIFLMKPTGTSSTMYACFVPSSKALQLEAAKRCQDEGSNLNSLITFTGALTDPCVAPFDGSLNEDNMVCLP